MRAVRRLEATENGTIPAVAVTAFASLGDRRQALQAGFTEHLAKPVDPARLVATVAGLGRRAGVTPGRT